MYQAAAAHAEDWQRRRQNGGVHDAAVHGGGAGDARGALARSGGAAAGLCLRHRCVSTWKAFSCLFSCLLHLQIYMRVEQLHFCFRIVCPSTCNACPQGVCLITLFAQKHIFLLAIALQLTAALAAGVPEAKRAAAEALTNMAATARVPPLATSNSESEKQDRGSADGDSASADPPATRTSMSKRSSNGEENNNANAKIDVQRAGAVAPLMAMLKLSDQRCVQAAATALYVLAAEDENRAAMAQAGVRLALQEARHFLHLLFLFFCFLLAFSFRPVCFSTRL